MSIEHYELDSLLANYKPGYALEQPFYTSPNIFEAEYQHIFSRQWQYVGHIARIPNQGDYFIFQIAGEEIIIVRGEGETVYAHFNVCRHRGSRICLESSGHAKRLTCPYHAWSYELNGRLAHARAMPVDFEYSQFGLNSCQVRLFEGMIFINLTPLGKGSVPDFDAIAAELRPWVEQADLRRTKIAYHDVIRSPVNWKVAVENYFECYHCITAHPELCKIQMYALRDAIATERAKVTFNEKNGEWQERATELGHMTGGMAHYWSKAKDEALTKQIYYAERMLIHHDMDAAYQKVGQKTPKLTKLLGSYAEDDQGHVDWGIMPSVFMYTSCTNSVMFRITPISPLVTEMANTWFVHEDAVEGVDYDVESLIWLDKITMDQDEEIVRNNQAGISSRTYTPGPLSNLESYMQKIHQNYIDTMRMGEASLVVD